MLVPREGVSSYATLAATYVASFTLAHVFLKASDAGLETADSVLKWTSNEKVLRSAAWGFVIFLYLFLVKVEPIMMGLRRVRSDVSTVRKDGVIWNGTEKVMLAL